MRLIASHLHQPASHTKLLWFLMIAYTMTLLLANWLNLGAIHIYNFYVDAGTFIFALIYPFAALITEVYGYKHARRAIWCGLLFNVMFVVLSQIIIHLPSPDYATNNHAFDALLKADPRRTFAALVTYAIVMPINIYLFAKQKSMFKHNFIYTRFLSSCYIAIVIGSILYHTLAFYGNISNNQLLWMMINTTLIKFIIVSVLIPICIFIAKKLKKYENLDICDDDINFNPLRLEVEYKTANNFFESS